MLVSTAGQTVTNALELLWLLSHPPSSLQGGAAESFASAVASRDTGSTNAEPSPNNSDGSPPPVPEVVPVKPGNTSPLFALIIGINKYKNHPSPQNLGGAVQDADAIKDFLISELHVPEDRIINLRNEQAIRANIIKEIEGLATNPAIGVEDPILIYYAGHGAEARAPVGWQTSTEGGLIQMLVPHDFSETGSKTNEGQGVFDYLLGSLLERIAKSKSNNITVIFDSCHSGAGTRGGRVETAAIRSVKLPPTYSIPLSVLQAAEESHRGMVIREEFEKSGLRSHVLFSGCRQGQLSGEVNGRGLFTSALLPVLQSDGVDKLTYEEVIKRLPDIVGQNPQCEGVFQSRILFNAKVASPGRALVQISNKGSVITVKAGEAYGITNNAEFAVYPDRKLTTALGHVVVTQTGVFDSICKPVEGSSFTFSEGFALQTRVGDNQDLAVAIQPDEKFLDVFAKIGQEMQSNTSRRSFRLADSLDDHPQLALSTKDGLVEFHIMDKICRTYGVQKAPFDDVKVTDSEYITNILRSAADFYFNLSQSARTPTRPLAGVVNIECYKLMPSGDINDDLSEDLAPEGSNLVVDKLITVDVDEEGLYGFKFTNKSVVPLWAAAFYFSPSDLSISPVYLPGSALNGTVDCSIQPKGSLTVGYGDSGGVPSSYSLSDKQTSDVGFLKLYLATEYVDWTSIEQKSPFRQSRAFTPGPPKSRVLWDALTIPIVQQRLGKDPTRKVTTNTETFSPEFVQLFNFKTG